MTTKGKKANPKILTNISDLFLMESRTTCVSYDTNSWLHYPTIINMHFIDIFSKIFEPYAKFWLNPLMELILQMKEKEQPGTEGINYFIVDLVVTMLSWSATAIPKVS